MKLIELIGASGSGKTTVAPLIKGVFLKEGIDVLSREEAVLESIQKGGSLGKFLNVLPAKQAEYLAKKVYNRRHRYESQYEFIAECMPLVMRAFDSQNGRDIPDEHKKEIIKWFLELGSYYQFFKNNLDQESFVIFNEGFIHRVVNLFVSDAENVDGQGIEKYLSEIPKVELVIKVDANPDVCKERLLKRGVTYRLRNKTDQEISQFIKNSVQCVNKAAVVLRDKGVPVIVVDNNNTLNQTKIKLDEGLSTHLKGLKV